MRETIENAVDIADTLAERFNPVKEFYRIPTPEDKQVYTADMLNSRTVLMMTEGDWSDEFKIQKYDINERKISTICTGNLLNNDETQGFSMRTLCVEPLVVADVWRNIVYEFSDDYLTAKTVDADDLDARSYKFSRSRNSLIYAVSTDYACELREYSFDDGESGLLMDLSRDYGQIWLTDLFDGDRVALLDCVKLFSGEERFVFADLSSQSVIGETETGFTYYDGPEELEAVSFDTGCGRCTIGRIDAEYGIKSALNLYSGGESDRINCFSISTAKCVGQAVEDGLVFDFENNESGKCAVNMYSTDGMLLKSGQFTVGEFTTMTMENALHPQNAADVSDEPVNVYLIIGGNAYAGDALIFGLGAGESIGSVVVWDTAQAESRGEAAEKSDMTFAVSPVTITDYSDANSEYVRQIEDAFGVNIYYGDEAEVDFTDYIVTPEYDESNIRRGLDALREAMELFPSGFFSDMLDGYMRNLNIYLCSELKPDGDESIDSAAAFTYMHYGNAIVVLDVEDNTSIFDNCCHEFMHVIDNRLRAEELLDEDVWNSLNPDGFEYNFSYKGEDGEDFDLSADAEYTAGDYDYRQTGDAEYVWFTDAYATTYPTEDRARLFEYAMAHGDDLPEFYKSSHIQAKLEYMFGLIRQCWDDSEWPDRTVWEKAVF